jgi:hypothetical protein
MMMRPMSTRITEATPALPTAAVQKRLPAPRVDSRMRLSLRIERLNIEGLAASEQGIFLASFRAKLNDLAQTTLQKDGLPGLVQRRRRTLRSIDGGVLPSGMDAKRMGERAATAIFRELVR